MRVLHCCAPAAAGGLETVIRLLASAQRAAGHAAHVAVTLDSSGASHPFACALRDAGIPVHEIVVGGSGYGRELSQLRACARDLQVEILHTHGFRSDAMGAVLRATSSTVHVSTLHGFIGRTRRGRLNEFVQLQALRGADRVLAVSRPVAARARDAGVPANRIIAMPNAVPAPSGVWSRAAARAHLGLDADTPVVGWIGRMSHEKGPDVFAEALAYIPSAAAVAILGDGPMRHDVTARLAHLGMRTVAPGLVPDAARLLPAFDVLVVSSRTEGTPMVLLEAMAARTPIVSTAVGGIPDVLTPDMALLVPPDQPLALAEAISTALNDPTAAAARAGEAHRQWSERYAVAAWLSAHDVAYHDAMQRVVGRPRR